MSAHAWATLAWWLKLGAWLVVAAGVLGFAIRREERLQRAEAARLAPLHHRLSAEDYQALEDELG